MKFLARGSQLYPVPGAPYQTGRFPRYIGRETSVADGKVSYPAKPEPWECDDKSATARAIRREFERCKALKLDPPLWPADKTTAESLGVQFVSVSVTDGIASPKE